MKQYICLLIVLLFVLFVYNLINYGSLIEPLESNDGTTPVKIVAQLVHWYTKILVQFNLYKIK